MRAAASDGPREADPPIARDCPAGTLESLLKRLRRSAASVLKGAERIAPDSPFHGSAHTTGEQCLHLGRLEGGGESVLPIA